MFHSMISTPRTFRRLAIRACLFFCVLTLATSAWAQNTPALVDDGLSVGAGATLAVAAGDLVARLESEVVPDRVTDERGALRRTGNIAYRTAKLLLFDRPQEHWLLVANHEVMGHGGRIREFYDGYLRFHIDAPRPYGDGGGVTTFAPDRDVTVHELQAISVAGMEANAVGAAMISRRAFASRRLAPREALRFLGFQLDALDYIQSTGDEPEPEGHDVSDFLVLYNLIGEFKGADPLSARTLRRQSWISLANPMVASAAFTIGRYLVTGNAEGPVWALPLGGWDVMPALHYRLTPYGTEWAVVTDVSHRARTAQVAFRSGRAPLTSPWGVGGTMNGWHISGWGVEVGGDLWRQPPLALGAVEDFGIDVIGAPLEWGGAVRGRVESPAIRLWSNVAPATLIVEIGAKSTGFVPGEPLDGGVVFRAGLGLPLGRR
jgi:hypothetical protein